MRKTLTPGPWLEDQVHHFSPVVLQDGSGNKEVLLKINLTPKTPKLQYINGMQGLYVRMNVLLVSILSILVSVLLPNQVCFTCQPGVWEQLWCQSAACRSS